MPDDDIQHSFTEYNRIYSFYGNVSPLISALEKGRQAKISTQYRISPHLPPERHVDH